MTKGDVKNVTVFFFSKYRKMTNWKEIKHCFIATSLHVEDDNAVLRAHQDEPAKA